MTASQEECIFCKISSGELGLPFVYESESVVAFNDMEPMAKEHVLVVPKRHVASVADLGQGDGLLLGEIFEAAKHVAGARGMTESGYRVVTNVGPDAGQSVFHVHFHVVGGERLGRFSA